MSWPINIVADRSEYYVALIRWVYPVSIPRNYTWWQLTTNEMEWSRTRNPILINYSLFKCYEKCQIMSNGFLKIRKKKRKKKLNARNTDAGLRVRLRPHATEKSTVFFFRRFWRFRIHSFNFLFLIERNFQVQRNGNGKIKNFAPSSSPQRRTLHHLAVDVFLLSLQLNPRAAVLGTRRRILYLKRTHFANLLPEKNEIHLSPVILFSFIKIFVQTNASG